MHFYEPGRASAFRRRIASAYRASGDATGSARTCWSGPAFSVHHPPIVDAAAAGIGSAPSLRTRELAYVLSNCSAGVVGWATLEGIESVNQMLR